MRIKKLHLENFRGFEKLDIEFPDDSNVVVFIGENGSGKTTILDAINNCLATYLNSAALIYDEELKPIKKGDIRIDSEGQSLILASIKQDSEENVMIKNELSEFDSRIFGDLFKYGNLSIFDSIPLIAYYGSKIYRYSDGSILKANSKQLLANYNSLNAPIANFIDFFKWFELESALQDRQKLETKNFDFVSKEIQTVSIAIVDFLNKIGEDSFSNFRLKNVLLPPQHIYDVPSKNILVIDKNNQTLEVESSLSTGEKILIQLITDIARRLTLANPSFENPLKGSGIVLIDEIDLHLHPKWQRNILPALTKIFPNIQFIVTTHSPQVLSNIPKNSVFLLENNQLSDKDIYTEGRDSNSILQDAFGVAEVEEKHRKELQEIYTLIDVGNASEAQEKLEKLIEKRGENDREIVRMKSYIDFL